VSGRPAYGLAFSQNAVQTQLPALLNPAMSNHYLEDIGTADICIEATGAPRPPGLFTAAAETRNTDERDD